MNKHIFQSLIDNITQYYGINQEDLFTEAKDYKSIEPRQLFFYLCYKKGIPAFDVQNFLQENDFSIHQSNILRGAKKIEAKIESNSDYDMLIKRLEIVTLDV